MARPKKNPMFVEKTCEQCHVIFQVKYVKRNIQRFCGKVCANAHPETKRKILESQKNTFDERYGGHPMLTENTKNNLKNSILEKYGVNHYSKIDGFKEQIQTTLFEKYGDKNYNNIEQIKKTCLSKYGVDNYKKTDEYKIRYKKTCIEKYNKEHASQSTNYKLAHKLNMFRKFIESDRFVNFIPKFEFDNYDGVNSTSIHKYPFLCKRCNGIELYDLSDGKDLRCSTCDKLYSTFQTDILNFVKSLTTHPIISNDRSLLYPKELDIYIPDLKIAIECDSLAFHSDVFGGKNKIYHLNKTKNCIVKETKLIHVWDNEWRSKQEIVKSILRNLLNVSTTKIYARKCVIKEPSSKESSDFLKENHMQGTDHPSIRLGLYHNEELVSLMTFCKPRFNRHYEWELSRYCNKLNTKVVGGASRLFKHFLGKINPKNIISYSDRRFFDGNLYLNLGFMFLDNTPPNYYYIIDRYYTTQNRMSWQKHLLVKKLEGFDETLTEWDNMQNHGFDRIWDCGNSKWSWSNKS